MNLGWHSLMEDAESLLTDDVTSARARTVVSRSYYAAYHVSLGFATAHGYQYNPLVKGGVHQQLSHYLTGSKDTKLRRLGSRLKDFHGLRIDADYRLSSSISISHARDALEMMSEIISAIPTAPP